ncbi:hypothetical protein ANN_21509 [Periplaneta americana]|uniref:DDE Tnp4 domain-containing protein n=1 Tax=Periplaneta americana TaxID=6978 RepID=A0ABQ8SHD2_PERAM|nr:hypothetical protein ANN_21509 [Periplaneta americana]
MTRNAVERCFGVWKQRFRCLLRGFPTSLENTKTYIVALAALHNLALEIGERNDVQFTKNQMSVTRFKEIVCEELLGMKNAENYEQIPNVNIPENHVLQETDKKTL